MTRFSANLGFLYTEFNLPGAIRTAHQDGFDAVECHWPYDVPVGEVIYALTNTGLTMLGLNTVRGKVGENGLSGLVGHEAEARDAIDQAIEYAQEIGTSSIHVMAGIASGDAARACFLDNLQYACAKATPMRITILIEPLNDGDALGYFVQNSAQAKTIIDAAGAGNLKLMFDCYHLQIMEGGLLEKLDALMPVIGHIQIASVPAYAEPDQGDLDYKLILRKLDALSCNRPIEAEYRPVATTRAGLGWLADFR